MVLDVRQDILSNEQSYFRRKLIWYILDRSFRFASNAAMFSTLEDGKIVKGLSGVPSEGPVLFVGYHMLMGLEIYPLCEEFLREKKVLVRGATHPELFVGKATSSYGEFSFLDWMRVFGAFPVSPSNLFKLLSTKSHVLLYPGGAREALHLKVCVCVTKLFSLPKLRNTVS